MGDWGVLLKEDIHTLQKNKEEKCWKRLED
jgi:hypothetical protein